MKILLSRFLLHHVDGWDQGIQKIPSFDGINKENGLDPMSKAGDGIRELLPSS